MKEQELEQMDLRALLDIYMDEARAFTAALERGASWNELKRLRTRIKTVSACISRKYDNPNAPGERRRDHRPPHGD